MLVSSSPICCAYATISLHWSNSFVSQERGAPIFEIKCFVTDHLHISIYTCISCIIKWSGILANFAHSWLAETCFPRPYLRVSTPQMLNDGRGLCDVTTKTQVFASIICSDWRVWCAFSYDVTIYAPHFAPIFACDWQRHGLFFVFEVNFM